MGIETYAVLENGEVVNTIVWDNEEPYTPEEGHTVIPAPEGVGIGWKLDLDTWVAPIMPDPPTAPTEDPAVLEAKNKALTQLIQLGISEDVARTIVGLPKEQ